MTHDTPRYVNLDAATETVKQIRGLDWEGEQQYALGPWLHRTDVLAALQSLPTRAMVNVSFPPEHDDELRLR